MLRRMVIALAAAALVLLAARLALDPLATWWMRRTLGGVGGADASFDHLRVQVRDLSCTVDGFRVPARRAGPAGPALLEIPQVRLRASGRDLLRGKVVLTLELDDPRLRVVRKQKPPKQPDPGRPREIAEAPRVGRRLEQLPGVLFARGQVRGGEIRFVDVGEDRRGVLVIRGIELTVENFPTHPELARAGETVLAGRATVQRTGALSLFATADPRAARATFGGRAEVAGLRLGELGDLVAARNDVAPDAGVLDMSVQFDAVAGRITGAVRPLVRGGGTRAAAPGLTSRIKSFVSDDRIELYDEKASAAVTTLPILGTVKPADAHPLPMIIAVVRSAFAQGLTAAMRGPPPSEVRARTPEQARRAVAPQGGRAARRPPPPRPAAPAPELR